MRHLTSSVQTCKISNRRICDLGLGSANARCHVKFLSAVFSRSGLTDIRLTLNNMSSLPTIELATTPMPTELGRYRLIGPLGQGGMATVYRARDTLLNIDRAIKVLHRQASLSSNLRQRFLTEASTLMRLVHPNVLRIYDVGETGDDCWYAMELLDIGSLQQHIDTAGPMPSTDALRTVFHILQALGAAHKSGIVHRDVKPSNILLRGDGQALLSDFGSARQAASMQLTRTGETLGTIGYMAPEQRADSRAAAESADIYAIGATLFGLVTGRAPLGLFEGQIDAMSLARLEPEVREVLRNATRYRPEHRYPTAREMALEVASTFDILVGHTGPNPARERWMAKFDMLIEAVVPGAAGPLPTPTEPSLRPEHFVPLPTAPRRTRVSRASDPPDLPKPPPASAKKSPPSILASAWTTLRDAVDRLVVGADLENLSVVGTWDGRMEEILPLRLELEMFTGGRITGWAVTTGLRGEVITRVDGTWSPIENVLELSDHGDRPDRGLYKASFSGGALTGTFQSIQPGSRVMSFTLTRRPSA